MCCSFSFHFPIYRVIFPSADLDLSLEQDFFFYVFIDLFYLSLPSEREIIFIMTLNSMLSM